MLINLCVLLSVGKQANIAHIEYVCLQCSEAKLLNVSVEADLRLFKIELTSSEQHAITIMIVLVGKKRKKYTINTIDCRSRKIHELIEKPIQTTSTVDAVSAATSKLLNMYMQRILIPPIHTLLYRRPNLINCCLNRFSVSSYRDFVSCWKWTSSLCQYLICSSNSLHTFSAVLY